MRLNEPKRLQEMVIQITWRLKWLEFERNILRGGEGVGNKKWNTKKNVAEDSEETVFYGCLYVNWV